MSGKEDELKIQTPMERSYDNKTKEQSDAKPLCLLCSYTAGHPVELKPEQERFEEDIGDFFDTLFGSMCGRVVSREPSKKWYVCKPCKLRIIESRIKAKECDIKDLERKVTDKKTEILQLNVLKVNIEQGLIKGENEKQ